METVQAIFTQLGVNSSLLPQFIIVLIVFVLAHLLFLKKLQEVLETREEKTVKLENSADETINNVQKMQTEYKIKIEQSHRESFKATSDKKQNITTKYTEQYKTTEKEVGIFVENSRQDFLKEVEKNKDQYLSEANQLSDSLVQKILQ